jgi:hypothetical protein
MSSNRWEEWMKKDLKKKYLKVPSKVLAKKYNKTPAAVQTMAWKLGAAGKGKSIERVSKANEELLEYVSYGFKPYQIANIMGMNEERVKTIIRGHS